MNDEAAFLAEIVTAADGEAALLAYADWLEERGDVWAEFLRLETMPGRLPGAGGEHDGANRRLAELRGTLDPRWLASVAVPGQLGRLKRRLASRFPGDPPIYERTLYERRCLYPPVAREQVIEAEEELGFALPPLLAGVYTQIGNGGGALCLIGLPGGQTAFDDLGYKGRDIVLGHYAYTAYRKAFRKRKWPTQLVPIYDALGCGMIDYLDCSSPEGKVWRSDSGEIGVEYDSLAGYFADAWPLRGH
jgi:uncharacterized protein (TIGR02996 family)